MSLRIVHCEIKVIPCGTCKNRYIIVRRMQLDANEVRAISHKFTLFMLYILILSYSHVDILTFNYKIVNYYLLGFYIC